MASGRQDPDKTGSGDLGIGTSDPTKALHILAGAPFPMRVESASGVDRGIEFANSAVR